MGFIMNLISRHDEFQADAYAKNRNYATDLKNGLIKIHLKNSSNLNPDKLYSIWHYSHPPLVERLSALLQKSKSD
ncbi:zinc metalloprotease [Batrachochytrium dendrobatidis]